jgi:TonB family protein
MAISRVIEGLPRRAGIAVAIGLVHYCCLTGWGNFPANSEDQGFPATEMLTATFIPEAPRVPDAVPLPVITLQRPTVDTSILTNVVFTNPDAGKVPGVVSPMSAPHPMAPDNRSRSIHARRAGLTPGEVLTVILGVQVLADGSVGDVTVAITSGNAAADELAMAYARSLKWVPGSVNRQATDMRIRYVIVLDG